MDYEKKYNEALERAKKTIEDCGGNEGRKKMIRDIFPELKESEDERIRKGLLEIFNKAQFGEWGKLKIKDIIAWLERQKEQKPAEWSKEDEKCCKIALLALNDHPLNQDELKTFNWLRALKSRFGWKPSEEQMKALNALNCHGDLSYVGQQEHLISLYNDIKKL